MNGKITMEEVKRTRIKPSIPTPPHLTTFKLSLLDQLSPDIHGNMTLFFPHNPNTHSSNFSTKSQLLQNSLSQILTLFYPFAGTLHDSTTILCDDHGADFVETLTHTSLSDILTTPDFDILHCLLPTVDNASLLAVRFHSFTCEGTAVSIALTHKIADIATLTTLLKSWKAVCGGATSLELPELTIGASLFPPREITIPSLSSSVKTASSEKFTTRRFVFEPSKVLELRNNVKTTAFNPSRVEAVLSLIWKCALTASCTETAPFKRSVLFQAVNLRPRMGVPESAIGNLVWPFAVTVEEESHVELHVLVTRMRKTMTEFIESTVDRFKEEGAFGVLMENLRERGEVLNQNSDTVVYKCTSWCKFSILESDFGWGEALWMSSVNKVASNTIALMDTKDGGGVEAFVTLDHQEITLFQQHQELLYYALLNPSIL